jgi:Tfp pilus assembly protein PilV
MSGDPGAARRQRKGFVIGELLVAALLLAVAVSSLAALMYSVSHRTESRVASGCVEKNGARAAKCASAPLPGGGPKVLRSECSTSGAIHPKGCTDSAVIGDGSGDVILRSRTDSVAIAIAAKRQKAARDAARTDRGFVR